ncbi:uncharacterized protein BDV17DRAFT_296824 [Aspergillus undulatus]|uniref:uncharacterized protein n=1 Tax=Aspergillus undulatus TaxID=1810928 RepID=UPI003CCC9A65
MLLDYTLKGDLFKSTLVNFLAVLGINRDYQGFQEPYYYTSYLSSLVKIAQILVVKHAVQLAEDSQTASPVDTLDKIRERFILYRQVFLSRRNSYLVHIRSQDPEPDEPPAPANNQQQIVAKIKARAAADAQEATSQVVKARELHDANPWLRITRWARYLAKETVYYQDLLDVVATPDPEQEDSISRATQVV